MPARSQFAAAIGNAEGVNVPGSLPARNNNPGDLRNWPGVPTDANGYSVFPSIQAGWDALEAELNDIRSSTSAYYNANMSIEQMGAIYADGDPNWAANVAAFLGTTANAIIGPLLGIEMAGTVASSPFISAPPPEISALPAAPQNPQTAILLAGIALGVFIIAREVFA